MERTRAARDRKVIACGRRGRRLWRRDEACVGAVPLTPRAKKVLEFSVAEARDSGSERVRPEHVLLALLREREGVASEILRRAGIDYARAYRTIQDELHGP